MWGSRAAAATLALSGLVAGCGGSPPGVRAGGAVGSGSPRPPGASPSTPRSPATPPPPATPTGSAPACALDISSWPVRRLAGAVITAPALMGDLAAAAPMVASGIGGVILFGRPGTDFEAGLDRLHAAAGAWPLLVASDEEGGGIQRLASLTGPLPWPRDLARRPAADVRAAARRMGARLRALGVRVDLAPVADLDAGPGPDAQHPDGRRSFSADPGTASTDTLAFAEGLRDAGILPVVKHFPGIGSASANTDAGAATTAPLSALRARDLHPFTAAIRAGLPAIMTSNAVTPGLSGLPVSISPAATTRLLRDELGFTGVVFTDSLSAAAIADAGLTVPQAAVRALLAGADDILIGKSDMGDPGALAASVRAAIVAAVADHRLPVSRLRASVARLALAMGRRTC